MGDRGTGAMVHNGSLQHTGSDLNDEITARIRHAAQNCAGPGDREWTVVDVVTIARGLGCDPADLILGTAAS